MEVEELDEDDEDGEYVQNADGRTISLIDSGACTPHPAVGTGDGTPCSLNLVGIVIRATMHVL